MKFLIVGQKRTGQIRRLRIEARKLGHTIEGCLANDLVIESGGGVFNVYANKKNLSDYDLVYLCAGVEQERRFEWYVAVDYLKKHFKTKIVNEMVINPSFKYYPVQSWFYLKEFENRIPSPETFTIYSEESLLKISKRLHYPLIVKISEMHRRTGVHLAKSENEVKTIIRKNINCTFLLRKFVPDNCDIRVFTIGFKAVGAMERIPKFKRRIYNLGEHEGVCELAQRAAKISGVEIAGVDIITDKNTNKNYLLEVNVGPKFSGLEKCGVNVAREIIKYFVTKCSN